MGKRVSTMGPTLLATASKGAKGSRFADWESVPGKNLTNKERRDENATTKRTNQLQKEHTPQGGVRGVLCKIYFINFTINES